MKKGSVTTSGMEGIEKTPVVLAIGGSDCSGGAGIQADMRAIVAARCRARTVITALTAQHAAAVIRIEPAPPAQIEAEMQAVFADGAVAAVKTGMLFDATRIGVISGMLAAMPESERPALVVDPVMAASSGRDLLDAGGRAALSGALLPLAALLTPNHAEAAFWLGRAVRDPLADARHLAESLELPVLLKGGHGAADAAGMLLDVLAFPGGEAHRLRHPYRSLEPEDARGTGCRLASSIAARLAKGNALPEACAAAIHALWGACEHE